MNWLEALVLGLVQGLTEFLPVSSSGHLAIGQALLGVDASENLFFDVVVHAATVLATIVVFRSQIWDLLKGLFRFRMNDETDYILKICVSMIPILFVGLFLDDYVEALFGSLFCVGGCLLITSVLLYFSDSISRAREAQAVEAPEHRNGISYVQALIIGIGQAFAVLPGLSRSGTTISTGLLCGVKREKVAQFSFLMVLVPILGEAFLQILKVFLRPESEEVVASAGTGVLPLIVGFVAAFVSGLFACKVMIAIVKKAKLKWFALYCVIAGVFALLCGILQNLWIL